MKPHGLALDIDNTLSASNIHWAKELERLYGNPTGMTPEELCEKYMLSSHVPHWKESPEAQEWMEQARRSPEIHHEYPLIENAKHMENLQQQDAALDSQIARNEKALRENLELLTKVKSNYELEKTVSEECVTLAGLIAELQASKRVTEDTLRKGADLLKKKEDELALQKAPPPPWKKK